MSKNEEIFIISKVNQIDNRISISKTANHISISKPVIWLTLDEVDYVLKCIRYLANGCDVQLKQSDIDDLWEFADKLYERKKESEKENEQPTDEM